MNGQAKPASCSPAGKPPRHGGHQKLFTFGGSLKRAAQFRSGREWPRLRGHLGAEGLLAGSCGASAGASYLRDQRAPETESPLGDNPLPFVARLGEFRWLKRPKPGSWGREKRAFHVKRTVSHFLRWFLTPTSCPGPTVPPPPPPVSRLGAVLEDRFVGSAPCWTPGRFHSAEVEWLRAQAEFVCS